MEENTFKKMSFKEKEQTLQAIFKEYHIAKHNLENDTMAYYPSHTMLIREQGSHSQFINYEQKLLDHLSKQNSYRQYVYYIENALLRLHPNHREVIEHEFIKQEQHLWWDCYYSRSTYYRYKKEAMCEMLSLLFSKTL